MPINNDETGPVYGHRVIDTMTKTVRQVNTRGFSYQGGPVEKTSESFGMTEQKALVESFDEQRFPIDEAYNGQLEEVTKFVD